MLLEVKNICKYFAIERGALRKETGQVKALDNVSFSLPQESVLGIVGESGSGKTTLAKIILRLIPPTSGECVFNDALIKNFRKDVQIIFQNPYNSLDPKMRISDIIAEPLIIHRILPARKVKDKAAELLRTVGLDAHALWRRPGEFSGGQRQRICIARALACEPKCIVLDEPISSLDLTIQAQILDLFLELKKRLRLTYIFISHNLSVIRHIAVAVIVMQNGRIVEQGTCKDVFTAPTQAYTKNLLAAAKA